MSETKDKKYDIYDPVNDKWVSFGQLGYEDFTKHNDKERRKNYLNRATNMNGNCTISIHLNIDNPTNVGLFCKSYSNNTNIYFSFNNTSYVTIIKLS